MMRRKLCALLVTLMALSAPAFAAGAVLPWAAPDAAVEEGDKTSNLLTASSGLRPAHDDRCATYGQPINSTTGNTELAGVPCLFRVSSLEVVVAKFHAERVERRERRLRRLARERRERIAKRRAEARAALNKCAIEVAREYAVGGEAARLRAAPDAVKAVVCAANEIDSYPYSWAGGHYGFEPGGEGENGGPGYDCSGAVSYALRGGEFIDSPLNSVGLEGWGESGPGRWITVYTNTTHAWMEVAGVRFDTREPPEGTTGPRWHSTGSSTDEFLARHPAGY